MRAKSARYLLAFALAAVSPAGSAEDWVEELDSPAAIDGRVPDWAVTNGAALATWIEPAGAGRQRLRLATLGAEGFGAARTVIEARELLVNWADFPRAARTGAGAVLVAWPSRRPAGGHNYDLKYSWGASGEERWSAPALLSSDDSDCEHGFVSLAPLDGGLCAAVWLDGRAVAGGGAAGLWLSILSETETEADAPRAERCLDARVCDCCQTAMVRLADGSLLVAYRDRGEGETRDIAYVRGRAGAASTWSAAATWSAPRAVHADGWVIAGCPVNGPALAAGDGRIAAAWFTLGADGVPRVLVAPYDADKDRFGAPLRIDDGDPEGRVALALLPGGRLFVSWLERVGEAAEWRLRPVPRAGGELPASRRIATVPLTRDSGFLRLAVMGEDLLAAWTDAGPRFARLHWDEEE